MQDLLRPDPRHPAAPKAAREASAGEYLDALAGRIDELVASTAREDWGEVRRVCQELADGGRACGCRAVSTMAQRVCDEVRRPDNVLGIKRSLLRLIGTCGREGLPQQTCAAMAD